MRPAPPQSTAAASVPFGPQAETSQSAVPFNAMAAEIIRLFDIAEARVWYPLLKAQKPEVRLEGAVLEIAYSSVFGEQWVLRSDTMVPQPR